MYLWIFLRGPVTFLGVLRVLTAITRITHVSFTYSIHYLPPFKATSAGLLTPYTTHCRKKTPLRPGTKLAVNWPESTATPSSPYIWHIYLVWKEDMPVFRVISVKLRKQLKRIRKYVIRWNEKDMRLCCACLGIIFAVQHGGKWRLESSCSVNKSFVFNF